MGKTATKVPLKNRKLPRPPKAVAARSWPREGLATIEDARQFFQCSRSTIYRLINEGALAAIQVRKYQRISWASIWAYSGHPTT